ncbi:MAG: DJ-1/PfpI family protein [candidate division WOR-3 bacterium]
MQRICYLSVIFSAAVAAGQSLSGQPTVSVPGAGPARTVAAFVPQHLFQDEEFEPAVRAMGKAGIQVIICSDETTAAVSTGRLFIKPSLSLRDVRPEDFGGLVIFGGPGGTLYWNDSTLLTTVRSFHRAGRLVAAIGAMPIVLANAGVVVGRRVTACRDSAAVKRIRGAGARYSFRGVEVDGNLVTAMDWHHSRDFGRAVAKALHVRLNKGRF